MAEIEDIQKLEVTDTTEINQELTKFRSGYYRNNFRLLVSLVFLLGIIDIVLVVTVFYLYIVQPKVPQEFYTTNLYNGEVTKIYPLDQPLLKSTDLAQWVQNAVIDSFKFNFVNYQDAFNNVKKYYTVDGWDAFSDSLNKSGVLDGLIAQKLFLSAAPAGKLVILDDGVTNGHHAWRVRMPVTLTFATSENAAPQSQQKITVNAIIVRVPNIDNPESIAIEQLDIGWQR